MSWNQRLLVARNTGPPEVKTKLAQAKAARDMHVRQRQLPELPPLVVSYVGLTKDSKRSIGRLCKAATPEVFAYLEALSNGEKHYLHMTADDAMVTLSYDGFVIRLRAAPQPLWEFQLTGAMCNFEQQALPPARRRHRPPRYEPEGLGTLGEAAATGDLAACKGWLDSGVTPDDPSHYYHDGMTDMAPPLWWAARRGHTRVVSTLLRADADPSWESGVGNTALRIAVIAGHVHIVHELLAGGAIGLRQSSVDETNESGETALMLASSFGQQQCVAALIAHGADPELRDIKGLTAHAVASDKAGLHLHGPVIVELLQLTIEKRHLCRARQQLAFACGDLGGDGLPFDVLAAVAAILAALPLSPQVIAAQPLNAIVARYAQLAPEPERTIRERRSSQRASQRNPGAGAVKPLYKAHARTATRKGRDRERERGSARSGSQGGTSTGCQLCGLSLATLVWCGLIMAMARSRNRHQQPGGLPDWAV